MAHQVVAVRGVSIALACRAFAISLSFDDSSKGAVVLSPCTANDPDCVETLHCIKAVVPSDFYLIGIPFGALKWYGFG
jgi:hypothetical protein